MCGGLVLNCQGNLHCRWLLPLWDGEENWNEKVRNCLGWDKCSFINERGRGKQVMQVPSLTTSWWCPTSPQATAALGKEPLCFIAKCDALWHRVSFGSFQVSSPGCVPSQCLALLTAGGIMRVTGWVRFEGTAGGYLACLLKQGSLDHLTGDCDQTIYLQRRRLRNLSGQSIPLLSQPPC